MQVSKITLTNFKGGKLPQAVKKAAKPVAEEIKPDFSVYAYGVPTGDMPKAINTAKEAVAPANYYPYSTPIKNTENSAKMVEDVADKNDKSHDYLSASMHIIKK